MSALDRRGHAVQHFSDRLATAVRARRSVVCVGLDPVLGRMPPELVDKYRPQAAELGEDAAVAACFQEFCSGVIDAVAGVAACVKPQAAFFEQYGAAGWRALGAVIRCAHEYELPVILDVKRGDIASTGAAYGHAAFGGAAGFAGPAPGIGADAVTASPYLGDDSLQPLVDHCATGHGVFVLTRTSNPGASLLQEIEVDGRPLFLRVADLVRKLGAAHVGEAGYSDVGAVAGATAPAQLRSVREALPNAFLLVPGYGAQGAGADALAGIAAGDAAGFVVNASRSIIFAWQGAGGDYRRAAADAAESMRNDLQDTL
jgi:orotidine-5'-phosphate decarboxylase